MLKNNKTRVAFIWLGGAELDTLPLAYANIAANTDAGLCEMRLFDLALGIPRREDLGREIAQFRPDIIGVSVPVIAVGRTIEAVREAKRAAPNALVLAGGGYVSAWPAGVMAHPEIDYAIRGEAEAAFGLFISELRSGAPRWERVPGLVRRAAGGLAENPPAVVAELDSLALPDYRFIRLDEYLRRGYRAAIGSVPGAPIQTTRGCPYDCAFCTCPSINGARVRHFSTAYMMRLIETLHRDFGIKWFNIIDDNFTYDPEKAKDFCRAALRLKIPGLGFGNMNGIRMQHGDKELWALMRRAGWEHFTVAPESGSERVLGLMKKRISLEETKNTVGDMRAAGLPVCGFFIIGYPGETREDLRQTGRFMRYFDLVEIYVFQLLPGSPVFMEMLKSGEITEGSVPPVENYSSGRRGYVSKELSDADLYRFMFAARILAILRHPGAALWRMRKINFRRSVGYFFTMIRTLFRFALEERARRRIK